MHRTSSPACGRTGSSISPSPPAGAAQLRPPGFSKRTDASLRTWFRSTAARRASVKKATRKHRPTFSGSDKRQSQTPETKEPQGSFGRSNVHDLPPDVELASHNPLSRLDTISVDALKNTPCILVASPEQQEEEQRFYRDIIGFKGEFLFAGSLQAARVMVVSNRGVMPIEGSNSDSFFGATLKRVPLTRDGIRLRRNYCAFWKKDNSGYYVEEFAEILKSMY